MVLLDLFQVMSYSDVLTLEVIDLLGQDNPPAY
jgi:hypothetical protein